MAPAPETPAAEALRVAVLADDLTGAGDTAVQFAEAGWPAFLQRTARPPALPGVAVVARALGTRALPGEDAAARTAAAVEGQLAAGVTRLYLKIDSTMRGSVAAQLRGALGAWRARHPGAFVVLCPAYPAMGRTVSEGRVFVNGAALERSPAGADPVTPVRTSLLAELVPGAALVPALPRASLRDVVAAAGASRPVVAVDARTPGDVQTLAEVVAGFGPAALPAGSAGLALPLASAWLAHAGAPAPAPLPIVHGRILVLLSSANEVSRRQLQACQDALGRELQRAALGLADVSADDRAARWAEALAVDPAARVIALTAPAERLQGLGQIEAGARVASALAAAAAALLARHGADALVLVGGDGAEAALDRLGVEALRVVRRVVEGVPLGESLGPGHPGLAVVTKAGGFGGDDTLRAVVARLRGEER